MTDVRTIEAMRADPQTLDEVLLVFQADPPVLVKDKKGQAGNQPTKYADLLQVNKKVLARLNRLGVIFVGKPTRIDGTFVLDYRMTHVPSGQSETGQFPLTSTDASQRQGSAISYARRYVLNALTGVAAEDEDDDGRPKPYTAQRASKPRSQAGATERTGHAANVAQRQTGQAGPSISDGSLPMLPGQQGEIGAAFDKFHITSRIERLDITIGIIGRHISSAVELTRGEAKTVMNELAEAAASGDPGKYLHQFLPDDTQREETPS